MNRDRRIALAALELRTWQLALCPLCDQGCEAAPCECLDNSEAERVAAAKLDLALAAPEDDPTPAPATCELCGEPMPQGEEVFTRHGYSGPCPTKPAPAPATCPTCRGTGCDPMSDVTNSLPCPSCRGAR